MMKKTLFWCGPSSLATFDSNFLFCRYFHIWFFFSHLKREKKNADFCQLRFSCTRWGAISTHLHKIDGCETVLRNNLSLMGLRVSIVFAEQPTISLSGWSDRIVIDVMAHSLLADSFCIGFVKLPFFLILHISNPLLSLCFTSPKNDKHFITL